MPCKISHLSEPDRPYLVTHGFSGGNGISFPSLIAAVCPPAPFLGSGERERGEAGTSGRGLETGAWLGWAARWVQPSWERVSCRAVLLSGHAQGARWLSWFSLPPRKS